MNHKGYLIAAAGVILCYCCCDVILPTVNPPMPLGQYLGETWGQIVIICLPIVLLTACALKSTRKK
jgi:hypothetical protein